MTGKILIIDDEPDICQLIADFVSGCGYTARAISDPTAFAGMYAAFKPDVVILDIVMPVMDGIQLIKQIPAPGPSLLILISGSNELYLNLAKSLAEVRADLKVISLKKPFSLTEIANILSQAGIKSSEA